MKKGDRVAICMANNPEYIISFMAVTSMGAVCVCLNSWWVPDEVTYGLENSGATVLIGDEKRLNGFRKIYRLKEDCCQATNDSNEYEDFDEFIAVNQITFMSQV